MNILQYIYSLDNSDTRDLIKYYFFTFFIGKKDISKCGFYIKKRKSSLDD